MIKAVKVRLRPTQAQEQKLWQSAGVSRFAYNWALIKQKENHDAGGKFLNDQTLRKEFTRLKQQESYAWLYEVSNNITKQAIKDANVAFMNFFKKKSKYPRFKSKKRSKPAFYNDSVKLKFKNDSFLIEKVGWVKISEPERIVEGKFYNPRISYDGKYWYISVGRDVEPIVQKLTAESLGVAFSKDNLAVASNEMVFSTIIETAKIKKLDKKITQTKKSLLRRYHMNQSEGLEKAIVTKNMRKKQKQLLLLNRRLSNVKLDYIHQTTTTLVKTKPNRIVMQSPQVKAISKNSSLAKSISDQGLYNFKRILEYKCRMYGINFIASTEDPSLYANTCYHCGHVSPHMGTQFTCLACGETTATDYQAAVNLSISNW